MQRFTIVFALILLIQFGCSRGLAPNANLDVADKALQTGLDAWKSGKSPQDLEKGKPSIIMNEDDWRAGKRLLDFTMEKGALSGRQVRCRVHIKLEGKDGEISERDAVYIIDTTPRIVIVRDSFAS
ncbi:MAG TPA: hypothetical protein VFE62_22970 [Gemmataceae bacterium]|nr:hypothetical protein [Gemmataceae bacterium]